MLWRHSLCGRVLRGMARWFSSSLSSKFIQPSSPLAFPCLQPLNPRAFPCLVYFRVINLRRAVRWCCLLCSGGWQWISTLSETFRFGKWHQLRLTKLLSPTVLSRGKTSDHQKDRITHAVSSNEELYFVFRTNVLHHNQLLSSLRQLLPCLRQLMLHVKVDNYILMG